MSSLLTFTSKKKLHLGCDSNVRKAYLKIRGILPGGMYFSSIITEGVFSDKCRQTCYLECLHLLMCRRHFWNQISVKKSKRLIGNNVQYLKAASLGIASFLYIIFFQNYIYVKNYSLSSCTQTLRRNCFYWLGLIQCLFFKASLKKRLFEFVQNCVE